MKAFLKNYHQSPRKVRLVATLIKGKKVTDALAQLDFAGRKAAPILKKLVNSAAANAVNNFNMVKEDLYIKTMTVDKGIIMKRYIPGARGRAYPIQKKTSQVRVELTAEAPAKKGKKKVAGSSLQVAAKKAVVKKPIAKSKTSKKKD